MGKLINLFFTYMRENVLFCVLVIAVFVLVMMTSLAVIFKKIRIHPWKAFIPFYNIIVVLTTVDIPYWMILLFFIPFVNFIGIPVMTLLLGWKFGSYCRKGIIMRVGLMFLPPLFYPLLAYSDITLEDNSKMDFAPVLPKHFKLDAIDVEDVEIKGAYSLSNDVLNEIAPQVKRTFSYTPIATKKKEINNNPDNVSLAANTGDVEDLNRVLPTADDLTFDYSTLYQGKFMEPKFESPIQPIEEEPEEEVVEEVIEEPEPVEEEEEIVLPVIHDVELEKAEPVEAMGPIAINKRDELSRKRVSAKKEKVVGTIPADALEEKPEKEEKAEESASSEEDEEVTVEEKEEEVAVDEAEKEEIDNEKSSEEQDEVVEKVEKEDIPVSEDPSIEEKPEEEIEVTPLEETPVEEVMSVTEEVEKEETLEETVPPVEETPVEETVSTEEEQPLEEAIPEVKEESAEVVPESVEEPEEKVETVENDSLETPVEEKVEEPIEPLDLPTSPALEPVSVAPKTEETVDGVQLAPPPLDEELPEVAPPPELTIDTTPVPAVEDTIFQPIQEVAPIHMEEENALEPQVPEEVFSMNIAEPEALPVGFLMTNAPVDPTIPQAAAQENNTLISSVVEDKDQSSKNINEIEMTKEEAMGFGPKKTFIDIGTLNSDINNNFNMGQNMAQNQMPQQMMNQPSIFTNPMMNTQQTTGAQMMTVNNGQTNYASIFQTADANGTPLLRPIESTLEKTCPVCGTKVKQECPVCIMCGHRF